MTPSLARLRTSGMFVTGTDTGIGKTVIAAAIALAVRRKNRRVGVCKIAATGCERRREGLVSEDAEYLAHWADSRHPLDVVCPQRWAEPLAPAVAAERASRSDGSKPSLDWPAVDRALSTISTDSDFMVVEGVGGVRVPMDEKHTVLDVIKWLGLPVVVVARPGLGTINHTLLTIDAIRSIGGIVAGVVINRYPPGTADVATETNPRAIERWGKTSVLAIAPDEPFVAPAMPGSVADAVAAVDWMALAGRD